MPKVNEEHFAMKENLIVEAAMRVCKRKPAYDVTLRDVVKESGISQGSMYCYFSSIDEIFAAIANRCYRETNPEGGVEKIFEREGSPEAIIENVLKTWGQVIEKKYMVYGKLINDINTIYYNDPERAKTISALVAVENGVDKIDAMLVAFIGKNIENGYFKPTTPKAYILLAVVMALQGIQRALSATEEDRDNYLNFIGLDEEHWSASGMAEALFKVVIDLLNIERTND
jgi:AcrR family transcriptional regulator